MEGDGEVAGGEVFNEVGWEEVSFGEGFFCEGDPLEGDPGFGGGGVGFWGDIGDIECEEEVDFAVGFTVLEEVIFGGGDEMFCGGGLSHFLLDFSDEGGTSGFAEFDMSAREIGASAFSGLAEEDVSIADADTACDGFDICVFVGHGRVYC